MPKKSPGPRAVRPKRPRVADNVSRYGAPSLSPAKLARLAGLPASPRSARQRIADNVKRYRTEHGLSQEKLAELAAFHRTYVSQLERCVTNITIDGLERLAQALGVDVSELLQD